MSDLRDPDFRIPQNAVREPDFPSGGLVTKSHYPASELNGWLEVLRMIPEFKKEMLRNSFHINYDRNKK